MIAKHIEEAAKERNINVSLNKACIAITSTVLPLFTNFVDLTLKDKALNKIIDEEISPTSKLYLTPSITSSNFIEETTKVAKPLGVPPIKSVC